MKRHTRCCDMSAWHTISTVYTRFVKQYVQVASRFVWQCESTGETVSELAIDASHGSGRQRIAALSCGHGGLEVVVMRPHELNGFQSIVEVGVRVWNGTKCLKITHGAGLELGVAFPNALPCEE